MEDSDINASATGNGRGVGRAVPVRCARNGFFVFINNKIDSLEDMNPSSVTGQIIAITVHPASEMLRMKTIVLN